MDARMCGWRATAAVMDVRMASAGSLADSIRIVAYWTVTLAVAWEMVAGSMWDLLRIEGDYQRPGMASERSKCLCQSVGEAMSLALPCHQSQDVSVGRPSANVNSP